MISSKMENSCYMSSLIIRKKFRLEPLVFKCKVPYIAIKFLEQTVPMPYVKKSKFLIKSSQSVMNPKRKIIQPLQWKTFISICQVCLFQKRLKISFLKRNLRLQTERLYEPQSKTAHQKNGKGFAFLLCSQERKTGIFTLKSIEGIQLLMNRQFMMVVMRKPSAICLQCAVINIAKR